MTRPRSISNELDSAAILKVSPVRAETSSSNCRPPIDALRHGDRISGAIAQAKLLARGERMVFCHHRDQLLFERHQRLEVGEKGRAEHHHEIDLVGRERRHRPFVVDDFHLERHQRMGFAEFGDLPRQKIERQRLAAGDAHRAAAQALEVLDLRLHALDFAVIAAQVVDENLAGGGQPHAARPAVEQRRAEFALRDRRSAD